MQTLICYTSDSRAYIEWLENGRPALQPADVPFRLPDETRNGDRYLLYVGGRDQTFVGWGTVESNWRTSQFGGWKGVEKIRCWDRMLSDPIAGDDVYAVTGFKAPKSAKVVHEKFAKEIWRVARGKPLTQTDRAVEGILTESRSRSRNAGLRLAAIQRSIGFCEGCGVNFAKKHGELGRQCLVVHHKKQLKDTDQPVETKLSDLAVVCANCHMMIHSNKNKALSLNQLKKRLQNS
jgi:hypothetical protein